MTKLTKFLQIQQEVFLKLNRIFEIKFYGQFSEKSCVKRTDRVRQSMRLLSLWNDPPEGQSSFFQKWKIQRFKDRAPPGPRGPARQFIWLKFYCALIESNWSRQWMSAAGPQWATSHLATSPLLRALWQQMDLTRLDDVTRRKHHYNNAQNVFSPPVPL